MLEQIEIAKPDSTPKSQTTTSESSSPLQWFREAITAIISLVTLGIAAIMLYDTYAYVRDTSPTADAAIIEARKVSYERQKGIMLYALALLGTVTGYYLGRVPAELHAQQAQRSANTAQDQLQKTQTKLNETAGSAAAATEQATAAEKENEAAKAKAARAAEALEVANDAISKTLSASQSAKVLAESAAPESPHVEGLRRAQQEIEASLRDIRNSRL
jgi:hypothetical protein